MPTITFYTTEKFSKEIKAHAKKNQRSLSNMIVLILKKQLEQED